MNPLVTGGFPSQRAIFVESIPISSDHDGDTRCTFACWTFNNMSTNALKLVDPTLPPPGMLFYCHNDCNKRWGIGSLAVNKYFTDTINIYFNLCCYFYQHCCLLLLLASSLIWRYIPQRSLKVHGSQAAWIMPWNGSIEVYRQTLTIGPIDKGNKKLYGGNKILVPCYPKTAWKLPLSLPRTSYA